MMRVRLSFQREGRPPSLEELGARLSCYRGKDQRYACAVGLVKGALIRLREAYAAWGFERRRREKEAERRRSEEMAAKTNVALAEVQQEWDAERAIFLKEYRRVVLGQKP